MSGNTERPEKRYREHGERWVLDEMPILWARPIGYIYICQECYERFESTQEIHIPMCDGCRLNKIEEMTRSMLRE